MTTGSARLTADQIRDFHEQGFLRLEALTSVDEVTSLAEVYDRLFAPDAVIAEADRVELGSDGDGRPVLPQILNPDHYVPELRRTAAYANARAIAYQLLGDEARHMGMHAIRKPARSGAETPWHQDEAYWDPAYEHRAISVWMPLQPATLDNGCMQFVPSSHRSGVHTHRLAGAGGQALAVTDPDVVGDVVACPLPPGGATVHAGRTLHYTGPNRTDRPRRALVMAFARPGRLLDEPRDFFWQPPEWYA